MKSTSPSLSLGGGLSLAGVLLAVLALFVAPWIATDDSRQTTTQLQTVIDEAYRQSGNFPAPAAFLTANNIRVVADIDAKLPPELQWLAATARSRGGFTGWTLMTEATVIEDSFRVGIYALLAGAALSLLGFGMGTLLPGSGIGTVVAGLSGAVCAISFLLVLRIVPTAPYFGFDDRLDVGLVCVLAGTRVGFGLWLAILSQIAMIAGGVAFYLQRSSASAVDDGESYEEP